MEQFRAWAVTHPGTVRDHNEDVYVNRPDLGLWAVADGAGGHDAGEVASGLIATALDSIPPELSAEETLTQVRMRMAATHAALRDRAARQGHGMIASTVVILIARHGHFACLWAGDSRAYLLRDGGLARVTRDHSLVQELVDCGEITDAEAENHPRANVITRAVGSEADMVELDKVTDRLARGDRFLLCSDGLCKELSDPELAAILQADGPEAAAERLVEAALERRARDNVTAVVMEVVGDGAV
ncbi:MAG: serine/threonine-protein phosphatase [Alphaproteobacteria bacterium]|nr:serine/threonine-protein phosphatase [Alphaproteobacteria bacterium]